MSESRSAWWGIGARAGGALAVSAVAIGAVGAASALTMPTIEPEETAIEIAAPAGDSVIACQGPTLALGRNAADATELSLAANATLLFGSTSDSQEVTSVELPNVSLEGVNGASLTASPTGAARTEIAGASSVSISTEDMSGFAVAPCRAPLLDQWIVGGDTATGTSSILTLSNPGKVAATVSVTAYGVEGPVLSPAASRIVVPADSQISLPLAGLVGGEIGPTLHIQSQKAPVTATLQSSIVRTLSPSGLDIQGSTTAGSTSHVIPGVSLVDPAGEGGVQTSAVGVRVLSPNEDATATIMARKSSAGQASTTEQTVELAAGIPTQIDLSDLEMGTYDIFVEADQEVVAAALAVTGFGAGDDYAWYTSAPVLGESAIVAVPAGPRPSLDIVNTGDEDLTVVATTDAGAKKDVTVAAGGSGRIELTAGASWTLEADGDSWFASVNYAAAASLASLPVWPSVQVTDQITIYP